MIYLDNAATTPIDPRVLDAMLPYLKGDFGNPASGTHAFGQTAARAVERAREEVAALLHCQPREIAWTSGATESNNLAIKGVAFANQKRGRHLVTLATEQIAGMKAHWQAEKDAISDIQALKEQLKAARPLHVGLQAAQDRCRTVKAQHAILQDSATKAAAALLAAQSALAESQIRLQEAEAECAAVRELVAAFKTGKIPNSLDDPRYFNIKTMPLYC